MSAAPHDLNNQRLSTRVSLGRDVTRDLRAVARDVAALHSRAERGPRIDAAASPAAVRAQWDANLDAVARFAPDVVSPELLHRITHLAHQYLAGRGDLLRERIANKRICDGHGGLLADAIYCTPVGPRILDDLDFNATFHWADGLADAASLVMDLERLGHRGLGVRFLADYCEFSGDTFPASLAHHYIALAAASGARISCLRHEQGETEAADEARHLLDMTFEHLERGRPVLALVGGAPATGKSTLASALADATGWMVVATDEVRHDVAGVGRDARVPRALATGIYDPLTTERTYREAITRAAALLSHGESVVIDGVWSNQHWRDAASAVGLATHADVVQFECTAPDVVRDGRIGARSAAGIDPPDAGLTPSGRLAAEFETWPTAHVLNTDNDISTTVAAAMEAIGRSGRLTAPVPVP